MFNPQVIGLLTILFLIIYKVAGFCNLRSRFSQDRIPSIIWCYWHDNNLPYIVEKCYQSIRSHHPSFEVKLLTEADVPQQLKTMKHGKRSLQHFSDLVRLWYLKEYGGVWVDISSYFTKPTIQLDHSFEFNGYSLNKPDEEHPLIENWFIATKKNGKIINLWWEEMLEIEKFETVDDYIKLLKKNKVPIDNISSPVYLWQHSALRKILFYNPELKERITLKWACEPDGPFELMSEANWDCQKMRELFSKKTYAYTKIRGSDRKCLEDIFFKSTVKPAETYENIMDDSLFSKVNSIENPYIQQKYILWPVLKHKFMEKNWPNTFEFDFVIKQDIVKVALNLPKNCSIIDCGAHIGDGSIPIAHALIENGRSDITVYAIDPSIYKCQFIEKIAKINNITNIKVINAGLSDNKKHMKLNPDVNDHNSGASIWKDNFTIPVENTEFVTLDSLEIKNIQIIHLDVELHELQALNGSVNTLKSKPQYLSIECNTPEDTIQIDNFLSGYSYIYKYTLASNRIYTPA